jgi:nitrate/nitrite transporter NarK
LGQALSKSWVGFAVAHFSLAVGQSGNFPSAIKAVAEWFPKKDRAIATGIFNGGANLGTILSPLIILHSLCHSRIGLPHRIAHRPFIGAENQNNQYLTKQ